MPTLLLMMLQCEFHHLNITGNMIPSQSGAYGGIATIVLICYSIYKLSVSFALFAHCLSFCLVIVVKVIIVFLLQVLFYGSTVLVCYILVIQILFMLLV